MFRSDGTVHCACGNGRRRWQRVQTPVASSQLQGVRSSAKKIEAVPLEKLQKSKPRAWPGGTDHSEKKIFQK